MQRSHSRRSFPANKPAPVEWIKGMTPAQSRTTKKMHNRKSRRYWKRNLEI